MKKQKELPKIKCSQCGEIFDRTELKYLQTGTMYFKVGVDSRGNTEYEQDEFEADDSGEFYHECGSPALDEGELKKLGVEY